MEKLGKLQLEDDSDMDVLARTNRPSKSNYSLKI